MKKILFTLFSLLPLVAMNGQVKVGETIYDLQTNESIEERIINHGNGTVSVAWTFAPASDDATYPGRGTAFNQVVNGTVGAFPVERLEDERTGWPSIGETASGRLFAISHSGASGLVFTYKDAGASEWTSTSLNNAAGVNLDAGGTWARSAVVGNTIHVIASRLNASIYDVNGGLNYLRSKDNGNTWEAFQLPNMNPETFSIFGGDAYALDANGDKVAIVAHTYSPVVWWSEDGGDSWDFFQLVDNGNIAYNPDGSNGEILPVVASEGAFENLIDDNGTLHVWYGRRVWIEGTTIGETAGARYFSSTGQGMMYWNSSMEAPEIISNTVLQDFTGDCEYQDETNPQHRNALVSMPSAGIDANGVLYLSYSAVVDGALDSQGEPFRDIYMIKSNDGGMTWVGPLNVTNSPTTDDVYGAIARRVDDNVHLLYQKDNFTGTVLFESHDEVGNVSNINDMIYQAVPVGSIVNPTNALSTCPQIFRLFNLNAKVDCAIDLESTFVSVTDYPDGDLTDEYLQVAGEIVYTAASVDEEEIFTISDSDGNSKNDTLTVSVQALDTEAPVATLNGSANMAVLVNTSFVDPGITVEDSYDGLGCPASDFVTVEGTVNIAVPGTHTLTYHVEDNAGNQAPDLVRTVEVITEDADGPVITLEDGGTIEAEAAVGAEFVAPGFTAIDNVDGDVSADVVVTGVEDVNLEEAGTYTITYTVTDAAGNTTTVTQVVNVVDTTAPVITLTSGATIFHTCDTEFTEPGYTAIDAIDGNVTAQVVVTGEVCESTPGTYKLTYKVSDNSGNEATKDRNIVVAGPGGNNAACSYDVDCESPFIGLNDLLLNQNIQVGPNPSNGVFEINIQDVETRDVSIEVIDMMGKNIRNFTRKNVNNNAAFSIDLTDLAKGKYFLHIHTDSGSIVKSVMTK
ncbi:MAG: DUF5011 domain-containing protein [Sphingobacteriales bacterium]|nr:DUF5011 domain-containing protein [Sphingobacteriales bacterium]